MKKKIIAAALTVGAAVAGFGATPASAHGSGTFIAQGVYIRAASNTRAVAHGQADRNETFTHYCIAMLGQSVGGNSAWTRLRRVKNNKEYKGYSSNQYLALGGRLDFVYSASCS